MAVRTKKALAESNGASTNGHAKEPSPKVSKGGLDIVIPRPRRTVLELHISNIDGSSLVTHAWDAKVQKQLLDSHMKKAKAPKEAKDPQALYEATMYRGPNGEHGVPAGAFKDAMVDALPLAGVGKNELSMKAAKCLFFIKYDFVSTNGMKCVLIKGKPQMRQDVVRIGQGKPDIRFRAEYKNWTAILRVSFNASILSNEQIVNLCATAGMSVGVGEMRPSSPISNTGDCGLWEIRGM